MKRLFALFLTLALTLALAACGTEPTAAPTEPTAATAAPDLTPG